MSKKEFAKIKLSILLFAFAIYVLLGAIFALVEKDTRDECIAKIESGFPCLGFYDQLVWYRPFLGVFLISVTIAVLFLISLGIKSDKIPSAEVL